LLSDEATITMSKWCCLQHCNWNCTKLQKSESYLSL